MAGMTSISWNTFFIGFIIIFLIWAFTTRTSLGQKIISYETPWSSSQWSKILLIFIATLFILVNPILHLVTGAIICALYYLFILNSDTKVLEIDTGIEKVDITSTSFPIQSSLLTITCNSSKYESLHTEKKALDKCLFSFLYIDSHTKPRMSYIHGEHKITVKISAEKYTSSLADYITKAGFEIKNIKFN